MSHLGKRLSALVDGELDGERRERALAHLARCEPCRQEAATLRLLKQRMRTLGEATAGAALTERLIAMADQGGQTSGSRWPVLAGSDPALAARHRRPVWAAAAAAVVALAIGLPVAGFALGGGQQTPGPEVTPAVDVFMVQHAITTGDTPARYGAVSSSPWAGRPSAPRRASRAVPTPSPRQPASAPAAAESPSPSMAGTVTSPARPSTRAVPASP